MTKNIWFKDYKLEQIIPFFEEGLVEHLKIKLEKIGDDYLSAKLLISDIHLQPLKMLNGSMNCVISESLGSVCSNLVVNPNEYYALGLEISSSHMNSAKPGDELIAHCRPLKLGKTIHFWEIEIYCDAKIISKSKLTTVIRKRI